MNFIQNYWVSILIILVVMAFLIVLWKKGKNDVVRKIIYAMVCKAEQMYGSKTGSIKVAEVWGMIYERLPWIIRLVFPKVELEKYIEDGVQVLKLQLRTKDMNLLNYNQEVESVIKDKITYPSKEEHPLIDEVYPNR